ncbi:MAG: DNA-protecting protein DprA [Clostridia bacterium]|nr:DNA-protecting protein DprA [Clostridia bacterium]
MKLGLDEAAVVLLDAFERLEYKRKAEILKLYSSPGKIFEDLAPLKKYFAGIGEEVAGKNLAAAISDRDFARNAVKRAIACTDAVVVRGSPEYPELLENTPAPPLALYCKGRAELLKSPKKFAIVGSRKTPSQYKTLAEDLSSRLSESGVAIVTGIAEGADASAIKGALSSGNIISVFAGGIDCVYPKAHQSLAEEIAKRGLIISEYPCGFAPRNYTFPVRNRIIAGLSDGVLIVGGDITSGARHTAGYAADYGREVCCLPYGLGAQGQLCKKLVKEGAALVESAEEISALMGYELSENSFGLDDEEREIYELIREGNASLDAVAENTDKNIQTIMRTVASLELKRFIARDYDGTYCAIK